ncbi:MAG: 16S rRNA (cytosine(1402)-N(4))-methyltransferase RsmH [Bacteroidales bacterium]|nr:16S rRNA (cytosine(1402)-N(4))-methyltransferase RsmH [Bacteroidales bacterium]
MYHRSVLLSESMEALAIQPGGIYVDATFGGGGHSREILKQLTTGHLFAFDQDAEAIKNRIDDPHLTMIHSNFRHIKNFLRLYDAIPVDGILADLGISSCQIDQADRGFSTRFEGPLDMRMDKRQKLHARQVVNDYPEEHLRKIFREDGEVDHPGKVAAMIVSARKERPIETTGELVSLLKPGAGRGKEHKYMAQVFQALRIEVNQELEALKEFLMQSVEVLGMGGRLVVISYHSLEDKLVKHFFRAGNWSGVVEKDFYGNALVPLQVVNRKAITADESEVIENPRARSARLRIAKKI